MGTDVIKVGDIRMYHRKYGFEHASFLFNPWVKDATFACLYENKHEVDKPNKFNPSKNYSENPKK